MKSSNKRMHTEDREEDWEQSDEKKIENDEEFSEKASSET